MKTNTFETDISSQHEVAQEADPVVRRVREIAEHGLSEVVIEGGFIMASADRLFKHPFGRDSAISADKLLRYNSEIARQSILLMVAKQGVQSDSLTEEEPGKIFHELKFRSNDPEQQAVFDQLREKLGIGNENEFISYTSIDGTLEFIHLVARYTQLYGADLLNTSVYRAGEAITVAQGVHDAVEWVRGNIAKSDIGLIGAHRTNPNGVIVPDLLDGATSFMHADGKTLINYLSEVNTINFQSLGYQALVDAASISVDKDDQMALLKEAELLKENTIKHFWMPEFGRVAMAIDRDEDGLPRRVETETILPAVALRTGIFDNYPDIVTSTLEGLYTEGMMTCAGPRTQDSATDVGYTRYQETPWPVLVGRVIEGAVRYQEYAIALDLTERLLSGAYATGRAEEFHQVTRDNKLGIYAGDPMPETIVISATNKPEAPQAWTAATLWEIVNEILPFLEEYRNAASPSDTQVDLSLNKQLETVYYVLDSEKAHQAEETILSAATR